MKNRFLHLMLYVSAALFFFAGPSSLHAQVVNPGNGNCTPAPNCVINGDLNPIGPGGCCNMNSSVPNTVPGWYISHGTPSLWSGAPTGGTYGLWMWSYSAQGEGAFTCYNFRQGHTYEICFWVMNTTTVTAGNLMVYAANGLVAVPPVGFGAPVPVPAGGQELINNTFVNSPVWTQVTYFYTPTANYNQLWIYPFMAGPPINNTQYSLAIDLVRVHDVNQQTVDLTIHSSADTITWCESATLCASGSPSGNYYWSPATGLNTTTGPCVVASPCSTTTYTVEADPDLCLNCHSTNSYTIVVVPPDVQAFSNGQVRCGDKIRLWVEPDLPCATIDWYDPLNNYVGSGQSISLPNANPSMSGTYRVEVSYGGCTITKYVTVEVVDCPCEFRPDFRVEGCNPVYFWDFTSGYATAVSWFWDFGDGNTSTLQNPSHVYASAGVYTVCLTVIGKVGKETCCNKICKDIRVCDPPRNPEKALLPEGSSEEPQPPVRLPENHLGSIVQSILLGRVPASKAELTVVPNPATEQAFVTVKNMVKPVVSIMDLNGSVIAAARMQSDGRYLVDLTSLASGMYLVVAEDATGRVTTKLVKN